MGHNEKVRCPHCGGTGRVDDRYAPEYGKWLEKSCSKCDGTGYIDYWTEDDRW